MIIKIPKAPKSYQYPRSARWERQVDALMTLLRKKGIDYRFIGVDFYFLKRGKWVKQKPGTVALFLPKLRMSRCNFLPIKQNLQISGPPKDDQQAGPGVAGSAAL